MKEDLITLTAKRVVKDLAEIIASSGEIQPGKTTALLMDKYEINAKDLDLLVNDVSGLVCQIIARAIEYSIEIVDDEEAGKYLMNRMEGSVKSGLWEAFVIGHQVGRNS